VNAVLFLLVGWLSGKLGLPFEVAGFWPAFWGAIVVAIVGFILHLIIPDSLDANDRVWLVTGASSGFGRQIAEAALAAGDTVVGAARRPEALGDLAAAHPGRLDAVRLDVTGPGLAAAVDDIVARHGRIDVLVNNAGRTQVGALEETTEDELRYLFELHFFGPALLTKAVLPHMRRQGGGAVVQMSSVGGQITMPGFGVYCATKFALEGLTRRCARRSTSVSAS